MLITTEDRKLILETFRQYPGGLSISDLARKSGLNRNKSSIIADDLEKEKILIRYQQGSSKIYSLIEQSGIHQLIEKIPDPALIIGQPFQIIGSNNAYTETGNTLPETIPFFSSNPALTEALKQELKTGKDGDKKIWTDGHETPVCTTIRITSALNVPLLILILHPDQKNRELVQVQSRIQNTIIELTSSLPEIMREQTGTDALNRAVAIIHAEISDTLIFTLHVREPKKSCSTGDILLPDQYQKPQEKNPIPVSQETRAYISDLDLIRHKNPEPLCLYAGTSDILKNSLIPQAIKELCTNTGVSFLLLQSLFTKNSLTGVLGIGILNDTLHPALYEGLLQKISGLLNLLTGHYTTTEEIKRKESEYQKNYSDMYRLLSEKIEENNHHRTEAEYLRSVLGVVLHTREVSLIVTTPEGILVSANKTACTEYGISEENLMNRSAIETILPTSLAIPFRKLLTGEEISGTLPACTFIQKSGDKKIHWLLVRPELVHNTAYCLFVGEKHPAPLIQYGLALKKSGIFIPGTGLIS